MKEDLLDRKSISWFKAIKMLITKDVVPYARLKEEKANKSMYYDLATSRTLENFRLKKSNKVLTTCIGMLQDNLDKVEVEKKELREHAAGFKKQIEKEKENIKLIVNGIKIKYGIYVNAETLEMNLPLQGKRGPG